MDRRQTWTPGSISPYPRCIGGKGSKVETAISPVSLEYQQESENMTRKCWNCKKPTGLKLLPCFHSSCVKCIKDWKDHAKGQPVQCKVCKEDLIIPGDDPDKLPDASGAVTEQEHAPRNCQICEEDFVRYICIICKVFICQRCYKGHKKLGATKNHQTMSMADWNKESDKSALIRSVGYCIDHVQENVNFFCTTCNQPVCSTCCILKHKTHELEELTTKADVEARQLKGHMRTLYQKMSSTEDNIDQLLGQLALDELGSDSKKDEVAQAAQTALAKLQQGFTDKMQELEDKLVQDKTALLTKEADVKKQVDDLIALQNKDIGDKAADLRSKQDARAKTAAEAEEKFRRGTTMELVTYCQGFQLQPDAGQVPVVAVTFPDCPAF